MMNIPFSKIKSAIGVASSVYSVVYAAYGLTIICAELKAEKQARKAGSDLNEKDIIDVTEYRIVE